MKKPVTLFLASMAMQLHAQIDRAGNLMGDDGLPPGGSLAPILWWMAAGAAAGALWAKYQQSKGKEFATGGGVVIGGFIGMFAGPILTILYK